jgi:hypothetical protein
MPDHAPPTEAFPPELGEPLAVLTCTAFDVWRHLNRRGRTTSCLRS